MLLSELKHVLVSSNISANKILYISLACNCCTLGLLVINQLAMSNYICCDYVKGEVWLCNYLVSTMITIWACLTKSWWSYYLKGSHYLRVMFIILMHLVRGYYSIFWLSWRTTEVNHVSMFCKLVQQLTTMWHEMVQCPRAKNHSKTGFRLKILP